MANPTEPVDILRSAGNTEFEKVKDHLIAEEAVTVMIDKVGSFTIMCTPTDIDALAVGFIFSEALIDDYTDILSVSIKDDLPNVVGIQVQDPTRIAQMRNLIVASSCGMCGVRNIEKLLNETPPCKDSMRLSCEDITRIMENVYRMQKLFQKTGGSHAAALFDSNCDIFAFSEDIGRHSALDKAIGKALLAGRSTTGCATALSGRISLEMVTKAARAGIEIVVAVSAPSSFAVKVAQKLNITLCGFVRGEKFNIYTHPHRVIGRTQK